MANQKHAFLRTDRSRLGVWWWTTDHWLLGATFALILLGVLLQFGTSPAAAERLGIAWPFHFAVRQCIFAVGGAAIVLATSMLSPKGARRAAFFIYLISIAAMFVLPFVGHAAKGATRWVELGGFTLQPSEFMKPALIVLIAWMFAEGQKGEGVPGVSIAFGLYALAVGLLLMEPDIGQTVLITAVFGAAFWMAGVPMSWIVALGSLAVVGLGSTYFLFQHVAARVGGFLATDKTGAHQQVHRAAEAIAAGRGFGRGPGEGVMKVQIPDMHTDFAYSAGAEEYGLMLSVGLIALFMLLVIRGLYKAMKLSDPFEQVASAGLFVLVGLQAFINVAVNLDLIPTKGMTLPFISYGGSSMLAMGLTMGLALALTRRRPGAYAASDSLAKAAALPDRPRAAGRIAVVAAGGTGGHLFPAEALARALIQRGWRIVLATDDRVSSLSHAFPAEEIVTLDAATVRRRDPVSLARAAVTIISGIVQGRAALARIQPDVVVGFGGYPSLPALIAALSQGRRTVIHEQNAVSGRANRFIAPYVTAIGCAFETLGKANARTQARKVVVGNPVRPEIRALADLAYEAPEEGGEIRLLITGGSQGARLLSELLPAAIAKLPESLRARLIVEQQTRPESLDVARSIYADAVVKAEIAPFFRDMSGRLARAHLVIGRSGASTVSEVAVAGRPSILIPLGVSLDDDQGQNAKVLETAGAAQVARENTLTQPMMTAALETLLTNPKRLAKMAAAARRVARPDAAERLADLVETTAL